MAITDHLKNYAGEFAERAHQRKIELDRKHSDLQVELAKVEAERQSASDALKRLANYPVKLGADYQCPRCWVQRGAMSPLKPIPSDTNDDLFRCQLCHLDLVIEN
jgi:hypothetical protein